MLDTSPRHTPEARDDDTPLTLNVRLADGRRYQPEAAEGFRVMELIRAHGLPMKAECGGAGLCATCHVRIPAAWREMLPPPTAEELAKLDEIADSDEGSRLSCQIMMTPGLDGLELEIASDSLEARMRATT